MSEESVVLNCLTDPTWSVLEIGPGGHPTPWPGLYTSVDLTEPGQLGTAGSEAGVVCTAHRQADMALLPFINETFNAVVARHVIEHSADTLSVLREWRRMLVPGGLLIVVTPDQQHYPGNTIHMDPTHRAAFTRDQLSALVTHAGFNDVKTSEAHPAWSFLLQARKP